MAPFQSLKRSALFNGRNLPSHPTGGTLVQLHSSKTTCRANGKPLKLISGFCISTDSYFIFLSQGDMYGRCFPKRNMRELIKSVNQNRHFCFFIQAWQTLEIPEFLAWRFKGAMVFSVAHRCLQLSWAAPALEDVNSFPVECWMMSNPPGSQL